MDTVDKRLLSLANEVAETSDKGIPRLLMRIKDILASAPVGSQELANLKVAVWTYDLLQVLTVTLKQDFGRLTGGWAIGAQLAKLLSQCCVGLDPPEKHEFTGVFLPDACDSILMLARKMQAKYLKTPKVMDMTRGELFAAFNTTLDALVELLSGYDWLCANVLKSTWLLQLLITDDKETAVSSMGLVQSANRMKPGVLGEVEEATIHNLLDELIYKLTATEESEIASASTRTVLVMCESHPPLVELLCTRYKGLRLLLNRWQGQGFGMNLRKLLMLLQAGSARKAEMDKLHRAAAVIQGLWKGVQTRRKLKKAQVSMAKFHRSFRTKQEIQERKKFVAKQQAELEHMLLMSRKKAMRDARQKQLTMLEVMPAGQIPKLLEEEQQRAATLIQSQWRGYRSRQQLDGRRSTYKEMRAAITLQRSVRTWLDRIRARKREPPAWQRPPGLTDERRVELQAYINEWREEHKVPERTRQEQEALHDKVQSMLRQYCARSRQTRKSEQHRKALLGQLDMDAQLLLNAPKLHDIAEKDLDLYTSRSVPIATKALQKHKEELKLLRQPWWKKLDDEYQERMGEENPEEWRIF